MRKYLNKGMLFLAIVTLISFTGGCADSKKDSGDTFSQAEKAKAHMLTVWSDYLRVQENMYASELWALEYTEKYLDTGEWNDLAKARTACIASARYLSELSMTEEDLSDEEYIILAEEGVDTGFQSLEFQTVPENVRDEHDFVRGAILENLEIGIFRNEGIELLKQTVSIRKEYIAHMCESECLTSNYLFLTLNDGEKTGEYQDEFSEQYPILCAEYKEWDDSESDLEKRMDQCLDQTEEITLSMADLMSAKNADHYNMTQTIENGDSEKWIESVFVMKNTPEFLPMPEWYDPKSIGYLSFIQEEDGELVYPESGDELEDADYGVYMEIAGVTEKEICDYVDMIRGMVQNIRKDESLQEWDIVMKDYSVRISLEEDTATLIFDGQDVTFVPKWYLEV